MIHLKRVYEPASHTDGYRILIDRLWPRGITKEKADVDQWLKEVAPSTELRQWFGHDPEKWKEFSSRYKKELKNSDALKELKQEIKKHKTVTLVYGAKDEGCNHARVLEQVLR